MALSRDSSLGGSETVCRDTDRDARAVMDSSEAGLERNTVWVPSIYHAADSQVHYRRKEKNESASNK